MTVCIATPTYYPIPGGIPNYAKHLVENLLSQGHKVVLLTVEHTNDNLEDSIEKNGHLVKVVLRKSYQEYKSSYSRYFRPGSYAAYEWIAVGKSMRDWLEKNHAAFRIDIVETSDYGGVGIFLIDDQLPPLAVIGHSSILQLERYNYGPGDDHATVLKQLERYSYEFADGIIAHSPMNQQALAGLCNRKIHFSRAPWTLPVDSEKKENMGKANLIVSGLQMTKGAALMAEAAKRIAVKNPAWQVYWVGGDTFTAPGVTKVSASLKKNYPETWNKSFIWRDGLSHEEVLDEIQHAELIIIPSLWDSFNYTALEAVYFKRPLLMTETTGASYLFTGDSKNVLIVTASAEAMVDVFSNKDQLSQWKHSIDSSSKEKLVTYFAPEAIVTERMEVYKNILANREKRADAPAAALKFLARYTTPKRKLYYFIRRTAKRIIKPDL